jgi:hypothetical protein
VRGFLQDISKEGRTRVSKSQSSIRGTCAMSHTNCFCPGDRRGGLVLRSRESLLCLGTVTALSTCIVDPFIPTNITPAVLGKPKFLFLSASRYHGGGSSSCRSRYSQNRSWESKVTCEAWLNSAFRRLLLRLLSNLPTSPPFPRLATKTYYLSCLPSFGSDYALLSPTGPVTGPLAPECVGRPLCRGCGNEQMTAAVSQVLSCRLREVVGRRRGGRLANQTLGWSC